MTQHLDLEDRTAPGGPVPERAADPSDRPPPRPRVAAGVVAGFTDALPAADSVVSSYAMHLAAPAEVPMMWYRIWETGADTVLVITPFKERPAAPEHYFERTDVVSGPFGPDGKTLYGMVFGRLPD